MISNSWIIFPISVFFAVIYSEKKIFQTKMKRKSLWKYQKKNQDSKPAGDESENEYIFLDYLLVQISN